MESERFEGRAIGTSEPEKNTDNDHLKVIQGPIRNAEETLGHLRKTEWTCPFHIREQKK